MAVKFQQNAKKQGDLYALCALTAMEQAGFEKTDDHFHIDDVGIEVDGVFNNKWDVAIPGEFKGSWNVDRPGSKRTDTVKKAIANAALLLVSEYAERFTPLLLVTSHLPERGDGLRMIEAAIAYGILLDVVCDRDGEKLRWYANATEEEMKELLLKRRQMRLFGEGNL